MEQYKNYGTYPNNVTVLYNNIDTERLPLVHRRISTSITRHYEGTKLLGMCKTSFLFSIYLIVYITFLLTGAIVFSLLETPAERALKTNLDGAIQKFLIDHPTVSGSS